MIDITLVYTTVKDIVNKDVNGFITPSIFNRFAFSAQTNIYNRIFHGVKDSKKHMRSGINPSGDKSYDKRALEDLSYYVKTSVVSRDSSSRVFAKPQDLSRIISMSTDSLLFNDDLTRVPIDINYDPSKTDRILKSQVSKPKESSPLSVVGDSIEVYPLSINRIRITYYKIPESRNSDGTRSSLLPAYTYSNNLESNFDFSNSRHFDLPEHYFDELVAEICSMAAANLRDPEVSKYSDTKIASNKQDKF